MFSDKLTFTGGGDILVPGTPFGGGYYAGRISIDGEIYALVVAPASVGGQTTSGLRWKTSNTGTSGTFSLNDGWVNTQSMVAAGISLHPAAQFCKNLTIGGYNDWYLPSVNELEVAYRNLKPSTIGNYVSEGPNGSTGYNPDSIPVGTAYTTSNPSRTNVSAFIEGGAEAFYTSNHYWTSTQLSSNPGPFAWAQSFAHGQQDFLSKNTPYFVRGFRRVLIS